MSSSTGTFRALKSSLCKLYALNLIVVPIKSELNRLVLKMLNGQIKWRLVVVSYHIELQRLDFLNLLL